MAIALVEAESVVASGGVVVYPTETLWGIGGDARRPEVLARVLAAKGIREPRPVPVLAADFDVVRGVAESVPGLEELAEAYWPGSLTLVLPLADAGLAHLAGPSGGVGLRVSAHPVARALARAAGGLLLSTSANLTGEPPPAVSEALSATILAASDGQVAWTQEALGQPSTVLIWDGRWRVARAGALDLAEVASCLRRAGVTLEVEGA